MIGTRLRHKYEANVYFNGNGLNGTLLPGSYVLTLKSAIADGNGNDLDAADSGLPGSGAPGYQFAFTLAAGTQVEIPVSQDPGTYTSTNAQTYLQTPEAVAVNAHGDYVVTWTATDPTTGLSRVYYRLYQADGQPADMPLYAIPRSEEIHFASQPTSGTWSLSFNGQTTGALAYNISASALQTALNSLSSISGVGASVQVVQGSNSSTYFVVFQGALAGTSGGSYSPLPRACSVPTRSPRSPKSSKAVPSRRRCPLWTPSPRPRW